MSLSSLLGDITQKGYEKKKAKLLASYIQQLPSKTNLYSIFCFSSSRPASLFPVSSSHPLSAFSKNPNSTSPTWKSDVSRIFRLIEKKVCLLEVHCDCGSLCLGCQREFLAFCGTLVAKIGIAHLFFKHGVTSDFSNDCVSEGNGKRVFALSV